MKRVLIAPDKFKGTLSAAAAARAMAEGVRRFTAGNGHGPRLLLRPLADGGEGSHDALKELPGLSEARLELTGADGRPISAPYLERASNDPNDELHYYLETALVIGLQNPAHRAVDIEDRTTAGIGEWIMHLIGKRIAAKQSAPGAGGPALNFHLFLGGSATSDGGFGLARALGYLFYDKAGEEITRFRQVDDLRSVIAPAPGLHDPPITVHVYTDVQSPLLGEQGAAHVFGPQKGATPEQVERIEHRLRLMENALIVNTGIIEPEQAGLGAAGGLALPFRFWPRGRTEFHSGIDFFLDTTGVARDLRDEPPDLVLTGEGSADRGTLAGKVPAGLAALCLDANVPLALFAGRIDPADRDTLSTSALFAHVFDTIEFCGPLQGTDAASLPEESEAAERLARSVAEGLKKMNAKQAS